MAKKKEKRNVPVAHAHIKSTFNNTIITLSDPEGAVLTWMSSGQVGFKGSRKSTPFAAQLAADAVATKAKDFGVKRVEVFMKGPGPGKETAMRALQSGGLEIGKVLDVTPRPHNGCRLKKKARLRELKANQ